jgi:hypothetical protein
LNIKIRDNNLKNSKQHKFEKRKDSDTMFNENSQRNNPNLPNNNDNVLINEDEFILNRQNSFENYRKISQMLDI